MCLPFLNSRPHQNKSNSFNQLYDCIISTTFCALLKLQFIFFSYEKQEFL